MTFPTITYKFNGIEEAKALPETVEQKMATLQKLIPVDAEVRCEVEFEKVTAQQHGRIYRVEANVSIDGRLYRGEATELTFDEAIDRVRDELDGEISRAKGKKETLAKRAGRAFKNLISRG